MSTRLKLLDLQDDTPVKITVELPAAIHRDLLAYAEAIVAEGGRQVEPAKLAPVMLARFMATDRAFSKFRSR